MQKEHTEIWKDRRHILWFPITFDKYWISDGRLYCRHGFIRQQEHECLLYRILDVSLTRGLLNRLCGTGTVTLKTTDESDSTLILKNIKNSKQVKDTISNLVEEERSNKGITGREILTTGGFEDFDGDGDPF